MFVNTLIFGNNQNALEALRGEGGPVMPGNRQQRTKSGRMPGLYGKERENRETTL
ncbi:MAG: hypothetical protein ABIH24_03180 [Verrucomicrobiota bacterium]